MNRKLVSGSLPGLNFFGKFILLLWCYCLFCQRFECQAAYRPPWTTPSGRRTGRGCRRIWSPGKILQPHCSPLKIFKQLKNILMLPTNGTEHDISITLLSNKIFYGFQGETTSFYRGPANKFFTKELDVNFTIILIIATWLKTSLAFLQRVMMSASGSRSQPINFSIQASTFF